MRMADQLQTVLFHGNDRAFKARVFAGDYQVLLNAALAEGISVTALVDAAGSLESALNWARENQPPPAEWQDVKEHASLNTSCKAVIGYQSVSNH